MLKKNKNGRCPFGYVEFNGMCVRENQMNQYIFSNEFTSSNGYQPVPPPPPPPPPPPTPPGPGPAPDDTEAFLRRAAEVTGAIFGVGVGALEADQRYEEYKVLERMRINRAAREVDEFYSMFSAPEPGEGITPTDIEMGYGDFANDEFPNLFRGTEEPMTDSMGRLLNDERFLINTDTEEGLSDMMTDADIQAEIQRMVEEAETGTTMRPQDGPETDPVQARRNKDAEQAAQEEYEKRQKAREAEGDPFEGAPEFDDIDLDLDNMGGDYDGDERITPVDEVDINAQVMSKMEQIEEYNKYLDATRDAESYDEYKAATEEYEEYQKYKAATEQYEDIAPYSYEPGQTPKQDVSDLAREMAEEMGTPLPDDVPSSPNMMTEEEWNSLEPGLKGGSEAAAAAAEEAVETAEKIILAARTTGKLVTAAEEASMLARVAEAALAGEETAMASALMGGLLSQGAAAFAPVLAAATEIAALTVLTYAGEEVYNAVSGVPTRPDSLDGAAHEVTQEEKDYFTYQVTEQVQKENNAGVYADHASGAPRRRQPNSPFAPKGSGSGERPTRQSDARNKALYNDMSDAEKNVFDANYNKMIADEQASINYWNNIPEGTMIQNSADGYQLIPPATVGKLNPKTGTPQSWIDDFNQQLENDKIRAQKDGIGNQETMAQEEMAAAQSEKDAEMKEVQDYLAYMDQRNEAYLASIGQLETQPEAEPEIPNIRIGKADITPLPQPQTRPRAPMPTETFDNA